MTTDINVDEVVDARGLMCPMPILVAAKAMKRIEPGQVIKILASDKGSLTDIPAWAEDTGNELLASTTEDDVYVFLIRKG